MHSYSSLVLMSPTVLQIRRRGPGSSEDWPRRGWSLSTLLPSVPIRRFNRFGFFPLPILLTWRGFLFLFLPSPHRCILFEDVRDHYNFTFLVNLSLPQYMCMILDWTYPTNTGLRMDVIEEDWRTCWSRGEGRQWVQQWSGGTEWNPVGCRSQHPWMECKYLLGAQGAQAHGEISWAALVYLLPQVCNGLSADDAAFPAHSLRPTGSSCSEYLCAPHFFLTKL